VNWRVELSPRAVHDLRDIDIQTGRRIDRALQQLRETGQGDLKKLQGREQEWRLRVGDWRLIVERDAAARMFRILRVLPRGRAYRV